MFYAGWKLEREVTWSGKPQTLEQQLLEGILKKKKNVLALKTTALQLLIIVKE